MLLRYISGGFDLLLEQITRFYHAEFADAAKMTALNDRYDNIVIGPQPPRP